MHLEKSAFFNSVNGDRKYKAEDFAEYFNSFIGNGVFPNPSTNLQVVSNGDMTVTVKPGKAWINGYIYINDDDLMLQLEPADGVLSRIDRIVIRLDTVDREIRLEVKKGEFASEPTPKDLQRDADAYELAIADIKINKGATSITQADITDLRLSTELCGIVHGTIEQVDTEVLFQDYLSWISQKKNEFNSDLIGYKTLKQEEIDKIQDDFQTDFIAWFNSIQDILDENAAGNLYLEIEKAKDEIENRNLPNNAKQYNSIAQWADILIPDETRGKALLEFLLTYEESSLQVTSSEQAMLVIMQEDRFDKNRQVPFDYDQIIFKLGQKTEVGQYLAWVEDLLADHRRGIEKIELGLMLEQGSLEIATNKYAMRVIMKGEQIVGLADYRRKLAYKEDLDSEVSGLNHKIDVEANRLDSKIDIEVKRLDGRIDSIK